MPENVEQQRSARARIVLWALAVVTVTMVVAYSYVGFGRTSADRDHGNVRSTADTNGTAGDGTGDIHGPGDAHTRNFDASGALAATAAAAAAATTTPRRMADDETQPAGTITGDATVLDDPTGKDRSADDEKVDRSDDDVSYGFYRATSADGSVRVVHQNVYSTINDDEYDDGRLAAAVADERHRYVHRDGGGGGGDGYHHGGYYYHGRRPPLVPRVEVEERPAHRTDWKTVAALVAVAKLAKLAAAGMLQLAFAAGFKLLLVAAAVSVKWLLLFKVGKVFHALAVVPLLLLLAASLSPAIVGLLLNRAQASSSSSLSGQPLSGVIGGGGISGSSSLQTLPAGSTGGSSLQMVSLPGTSSSTIAADDGRTSEASRDRERCVELAACRAAAADKVGGVVPAWINRILNGVSKAVPDEKIKLYFKTYNDVNIEMYSTPSSSQINWETWCKERYDCNGVNVTTVVANNKK